MRTQQRCAGGHILHHAILETRTSQSDTRVTLGQWEYGRSKWDYSSGRIIISYKITLPISGRI